MAMRKARSKKKSPHSGMSGPARSLRVALRLAMQVENKMGPSPGSPGVGRLAPSPKSPKARTKFRALWPPPGRVGTPPAGGWKTLRKNETPDGDRG